MGGRTETKRPKRWRAASDGTWLTGQLVKLRDGSWRMAVDGYVTGSELQEVHGMTPDLIEKFLPEHDERAVIEYGGGCVLYSTDRVNAVLKSPAYVVEKEKEKTDRRRQAAQKGAAKRAATLVRKREAEEKAEAEARAAFGGGIYLVRCTYAYGWREYGVYARDTDHARVLMDKWLRSEEGRIESTDLHEDAVDCYKEEDEHYCDLKRGAIRDEGLRKPNRPKKAEFRLTIEAVKESELDAADYEMEEVWFENEGGGWDHDIFADGEEHTYRPDVEFTFEIKPDKQTHKTPSVSEGERGCAAALAAFTLIVLVLAAFSCG